MKVLLRKLLLLPKPISSIGKLELKHKNPPQKNKNLPAFVLSFSTLLIFSGKKSNQGFSLLHLKGMVHLKSL